MGMNCGPRHESRRKRKLHVSNHSRTWVAAAAMRRAPWGQRPGGKALQYSSQSHLVDVGARALHVARLRRQHDNVRGFPDAPLHEVDELLERHGLAVAENSSDDQKPLRNEGSSTFCQRCRHWMWSREGTCAQICFHWRLPCSVMASHSLMSSSAVHGRRTACTLAGASLMGVSGRS